MHSNTVEIEVANYMELMKNTAKLELIETLVRTVPNYSIGDILRHLFPKPVTTEKVEG